MPAPMDIEDAGSAARRSQWEEKNGLRPVFLGLLAVAILGVVIVIDWSLSSRGGTPTTPTTLKATTGKLVVISKVVGVDYQKLIGNATLEGKFKEVVKGKYEQVGNFDILPEDVALELSAGSTENSVIVQATINWNRTAIVAARLAKIDFCAGGLHRELCHCAGHAFHKDLATKIAEVAGEAKSGKVTAEMVSITVQPKEMASKTKAEYDAAFVPDKSCTDADWQGSWKDMFSPDDTNPDSRRFIDLDEKAGELQVSADTGAEQWGRRFDKTTSVNPVLAPTEQSCVRKTLFLSKVPSDAPVYSYPRSAPVYPRLVLGTAFGEKVIKWNGLYDGKGGQFDGKTVPAEDSDNFWRYVSEDGTTGDGSKKPAAKSEDGTTGDGSKKPAAKSEDDSTSAGDAKEPTKDDSTSGGDAKEPTKDRGDDNFRPPNAAGVNAVITSHENEGSVTWYTIVYTEDGSDRSYKKRFNDFKEFDKFVRRESAIPNKILPVLPDSGLTSLVFKHMKDENAIAKRQESLQKYLDALVRYGKPGLLKFLEGDFRRA